MSQTLPPTSETAHAVHYAVRVGMHGQVGRFLASDSRYRRGTQVICRTARGLEVGQVLGDLEWSCPAGAHEFDGRIVRALAAEDQLFWQQLKLLAENAYAACQVWLSHSGLPDRLLDVEALLDGRTLYFHFLDGVSSPTEQQIAELVSIYQQTIASSEFAQLVEKGCGPGCGTTAAKGCGSACSTCTSRCAVRVP